MNFPSRRTSRKLLVATVGLGTVSYLGAACFVSGNLMAPPPCDGGNANDCYSGAASTGTGGASGNSSSGAGGQDGGTGTGAQDGG
jgi:hypothetical protein